MSDQRVESVNVGKARPVPWGSLKHSAIDKRSVDGPVRVVPLGLETDEIADQRHHGGPDKAVYAFAGEDLDSWSVEFDRALPPGGFGENLTTRGIDLNDVRVGDRWQIGSVLLEAAGVRIPCSVFAGFVDQPRWVRRFTENGRPGIYFRVLEPGHLRAGDAIHVVDKRSHSVTIGLMFRALTTEQTLLPRLLDEPRVAYEARQRAERYVARNG